MQITATDAKGYQNVFPSPWHFFNSARFNEHNRERCEQLHYLVFADDKPRAGIICGVRDNMLLSPFSAPYGGFTVHNELVKIPCLEEAARLLVEFARKEKLAGIRITLPPLFYNDTISAKTLNILYRLGFQINNLELNYHFDLVRQPADPLLAIPSKARNKTRQALQNGLELEQGTSPDIIAAAYEVIRHNRAERGHPLRMSLDQVLAMKKLVKMDTFIVKHGADVIGASINYWVSDDIILIVYWGDIPARADLKTMNFLSYKINEYYRGRGVRYIDVSYSTEDSVPNYGLCEFKENVGCLATPKYSLELML